jgi:hypothetical protein
VTFKGHPAVVQLLLGAGAAVDAAAGNYRGDTALILAAQGVHAKVVQLLLNAQASVHAASPDGCTALHSAAYRGYPAIVKLLLDANASADAAVSDGSTALHYAVQQAHTAVLQLLVDAQADPSAADAYGRTPLCIAAMRGDSRAVEVLVSAPQLATDVIVGAARAAAAAGRVQSAVAALRGVMTRDMSAAAAELANPSVAAEVLRQWEAAAGAAREQEARLRDSIAEQEARWPALQQLLVGIATSNQQLRAATAGSTASVGAAAVQTATMLPQTCHASEAADEAAGAAAVPVAHCVASTVQSL